MLPPNVNTNGDDEMMRWWWALYSLWISFENHLVCINTIWPFSMTSHFAIVDFMSSFFLPQTDRAQLDCWHQLIFNTEFNLLFRDTVPKFGTHSINSLHAKLYRKWINTQSTLVVEQLIKSVACVVDLCLQFLVQSGAQYFFLTLQHSICIYLFFLVYRVFTISCFITSY